MTSADPPGMIYACHKLCNRCSGAIRLLFVLLFLGHLELSNAQICIAFRFDPFLALLRNFFRNDVASRLMTSCALHRNRFCIRIIRFELIIAANKVSACACAYSQRVFMHISETIHFSFLHNSLSVHVMKCTMSWMFRVIRMWNVL